MLTHIKYYWQLLQIISLKKIYNFIRLEIDFLLSKLFHRIIYHSYPYSIAVEPTNHCQLQCPECPVGNKNSTRPKGNIDFEHFKSLIDTTKNTIFNLSLYFQGEPFLNKNIFEYIEYASQKKIFVNTSTNAQCIDELTAEKIVLSGLHYIIVSMDGYSQESYSAYRQGGQFEKVINALQYIYTAKKKFKSIFPIVEVQCLLLSTTENHRKKIISLAKKHGANRIQFKTAQFYNLTSPLMPQNAKNSRYKLNSNGIYQHKSPHKGLCHRAWTSVVITYDNQILPCCFDKNASFSYGNFNENKWKNLSTNPKFIHFMQCLMRNKSTFSMCKNCL